MKNIKSRVLLKKVPYEHLFSFAKHTTYGCGGVAQTAYFPETAAQAIAVFDYLKQNKIKFVTLGAGSNVLASDGEYDGAVLSTRNLKGIYLTKRGTLFCRAGVRVSELLNFCVENGLGGLEYLAGIPATIGGIAYMNGGAGGKYISSNINKVKLYDGKLRQISNKNCHFGYKYSTMRDINAIILGVELNFLPDCGENIKRNIKLQLKKREALPKGKSCGCVFKNVCGISAGKIIENAGLKGLTCGKAAVSDIHANFIINGGTCANDVKNLIREVKRIVFEKFSIMLEEEVVYVGGST